MSTPPSVSDKRLLEMLERAFEHHAGKDAQIDKTELQKALGLTSEFLAGRVLRCLDKDGNGVVSKDEFMSGVRALVMGTERDKLNFAFRIHDENGDGFLDKDELFKMISISLAECEIRERPTQPAEWLTKMVFQKADTNGDGRISFEEFEAVMRQFPTLLAKMTRSEAMWIAPNEDLLEWIDSRARKTEPAEQRSAGRSWGPAIVLLVWIGANVAVGGYAFWKGGAMHQNVFMAAGRALGKCIALNGALILVPVMRRVWSAVRASPLHKIVPLDDAIAFHRILGHTLFALAITHGVAFGLAYATGHSRHPVSAMVATKAGLSGTILLGVFAVMWLFSLSFVRRSGRFELFYFTHLLFVVWFVLSIVHAPSFALWAGVPIGVFLIERLLRALRRSRGREVVSAEALRSGVTRIEVARPAGFQFSPGDYAFLRVPAVARHEWHPFTISSAPERDNIVFHVRALGNWTSELRRLVEEKGGAGLVAHVDGPYGTPSAHIFQSKVAVLVATGIGVTPFSSVLESMVMRMNGKSDRPSKLENVHFFWVNRDQYSFEWFTALLHHLESLDKHALLQIHLCLSSKRAGAASLGLELARQIMHFSGRSDLVTGLRAHTHVGPPDWEKELRNIVKRHAGKQVDLYYCGHPGLGARLKPLCKKLGIHFREELF